MKRMLALFAVLLVAACAPQTYQSTGKIEVLWLGQSAFRITTVSGKVIVTDPFLLKNPKTPDQYKDLKNLGKVDLVLVTHAHFDHMADAPALAKMHNAPLYAPAGFNDTLVRVGEMPANLAPRMNKGGTVTPIGPDIKITMVRAEHSSDYVWRDPASGKEMMLPAGEPVGWIIELENGFKIYHMGDTGLFGDMRLIGDYYKPDLLLIPIGGHFVLPPRDAAYATREMIKPKFVVPMHYGTFPVLRGTPKEYMDALGAPGIVVFPIQPGEKLTF